jgi:hypothetical protein
VAHPACCLMDTKDCLLSSKVAGHEIGQLTASSADVKNEWQHELYLHGVQRDTFTILHFCMNL